MKYTYVPSLIFAIAIFGCTQEEADPLDLMTPEVRDMSATPVEPLDAAPIVDLGPDAAPVEIVDVGRPADTGILAACDDDIDNDGDGLVDGDDPGCDGPGDDDEVDPIVLPECADGADNDGDGAVDLEDTDCLSGADPTERGATPAGDCSNGIDDDGDGLTDFPLDPGCGAAGDSDEADSDLATTCANGLDDDGDGRIDYPNDPGCQGRGDMDEIDPPILPACGNGEDDDDNGMTDFPADPGCDSAADRDESNPCGDVQLVDLNAHLEQNAVYDGNLEGLESGAVGTCGGRAGGEVAFLWRVDRRVERLTFDTRHEETTAPTVLYVRRVCGGEDLICNRGNDDVPGTFATLDRPEQGIYFVIVDTGSREVIGDFRLTVEIEYPPECRDGIDNDEDALIDNDDPGCAEFDDPDEIDPVDPPVCSNGLDDDGDGVTDYPADVECLTAGYDREQPLCDLDIPYLAIGQEGGRFVLDAPEAPMSAAQGTCGGALSREGVLVITLDDPSNLSVQTFLGDLQTSVPVYARTDCLTADTEIGCRPPGTGTPLDLDNLDRGVYFVLIEQPGPNDALPITVEVVIESNIRECNDLVDNDQDGRVDLADPGCVEGLDDSELDPPEVPECADGQDNDGDDAIDWPDDDGCTGAGDTGEAPRCAFTDEVFEVGQAGGRVAYNSAGQPSAGEAGCGGGGGQAVVAITVAQRSSLRATIVDNAYDTLIHLRAVCDDPATELACNDDANGLASEIAGIIVEPGTYFLFLDGFFGAEGAGSVDIALTPL